MSAYICNPEHFAALAWRATEYGHRNAVIPGLRMSDRYETAQRIARELAAQNIRSVATRYPGDKDGERPGPCMGAQEIMDEAARIADAMCIRPPQLSTVAYLKMCDCYEYQACETPDWRETDAHHQIMWIRKALIREMPGYDDAPWSYETGRYDSSVPNDGTTGPICLSALIRR